MTLPDMATDEETEKKNDEIRKFLERVAARGEQNLATRPGNFRGLFYGNDGTGKTIAGLALLNSIVPASKRIILIDTSENGLSINNHPKLKSRLPDGSPRITRLAYGGERDLHALAGAIELGMGGYENVGGIQFDEFSTMADSLLAGILKTVEKENPNRPKDDATWPEYKMLRRKCINIITTFGALEGVHCTFITHYRTDKDGRNLPVESPNLIPSVAPEIRKPMHVIAYLSLDETGARTFQVQPDRGHVAKCKLGGLERSVGFKELADATKRFVNGETPAETKEIVIPETRVTDTNDEGWELNE